jgi:hypothetical protein
VCVLCVCFVCVFCVCVCIESQRYLGFIQQIHQGTDISGRSSPESLPVMRIYGKFTMALTFENFRSFPLSALARFPSLLSALRRRERQRAGAAGGGAAGREARRGRRRVSLIDLSGRLRHLCSALVVA